MSDTVYSKIDPELKARWVSALRSGKYKQTKSALETKEGCNCCLGVLARIQDVPTVEDTDKVYTFVRFLFERPVSGSVYNSSTFPPDDWAGLSFAMQMKLAEMNDGGQSFAEIVDFIEANY